MLSTLFDVFAIVFSATGLSVIALLLIGLKIWHAVVQARAAKRASGDAETDHPE